MILKICEFDKAFLHKKMNPPSNMSLQFNAVYIHILNIEEYFLSFSYDCNSEKKEYK